MKGLSDIEKIGLYKIFKNGNITIQSELRHRLLDYYKNFEINDLKLFYNEIIEAIGFYELDYILSNLYLEPNSVEILNYLFSLKHTKHVYEHHLNQKNVKILLEFEKEYLINKRVSKDFFNLTIFNTLNSLTNNILIPNSSNYFDTLTSIYPKWIANNLQTDLELKSYYWFVIIWQSFILDSDNLKNILFLHKFISEYKINFSSYLSKFLNNIKYQYEQHFNTKFFIPLITNTENLKSGYFTRKAEFDKLVFESELLNEISLITLFDKLLNNINDNVLLRLISIRIEELILKENSIDKNIVELLCQKNKNIYTNYYLKKIICKYYIFNYYNLNLNTSLKTNPLTNDTIKQDTNSYDSSYKPIRLINLAVTYNVSPNTIIDFLSTRGYIANKINNNSIVNEQMYSMIHTHFLKQKKDKSKAEKVTFKELSNYKGSKKHKK